jgi:penicillin-binding protein 1A
MREALVRSMNLASVRLLLNNTGIGNTVRHLKPFGFGDNALIRNGSLALGGGNATPLDMAQAYAVFANGGYAVKPYVIDSIFGPSDELLYRAEPQVVCQRCEQPEQPDEPGVDPLVAELEADLPAELRTDGNAMSLEQMAAVGETYQPDASVLPELYSHVKLAPRVISAQNAYIIQDMMRDVILRGTGRRARVLGRKDLSGKTGTSNDRRDAWFAGFNGDMSAIVWVGYDDSEPLGPGEEGSRTALPVWIEFARVALAGAPENQMPMPPGIVTARISKRTGCMAVGDAAAAEDTMFEIFRVGQVPVCEEAEEQEDIFNNDDDFQFGEEAEPDEPLF